MSDASVRMIPAHELTLKVSVPEWVPGHEDRGHDMPDFIHNRKQLHDDGHDFCLGCAIAGIILKDDLQCHHLSEWAEWNSADPEAVLRLAQHLDIYGYAAKIGDAPIASPNDIRLLMMLCQPCHTGAPKDPATVVEEPTGYISGGIHYCTLVDWIADRVRVRKVMAAQAVAMAGAS